MGRLESDPKLHIYHYASYEPTAVKRLAGRYGTREEEVDQLLRGGVFVDLYRAVRQGIRASVESYSIKRLERLYGFDREVDLRDAGASIVEFETWLELGQEDKRDKLLMEIEGYNRDDCVSTLRLRNWLEDQRAELVRELGDLPRPTVPDPEEREDSEAQKAVNKLVDALLATLPKSIELMSDDERGTLAAGAVAELAPEGGEVLLVAVLPSLGRTNRRGASRGARRAGRVDLRGFMAGSRPPGHDRPSTGFASRHRTTPSGLIARRTILKRRSPSGK